MFLFTHSTFIMNSTTAATDNGPITSGRVYVECNSKPLRIKFEDSTGKHHLVYVLTEKRGDERHFVKMSPVSAKRVVDAYHEARGMSFRCVLMCVHDTNVSLTPEKYIAYVSVLLSVKRLREVISWKSTDYLSEAALRSPEFARAFESWAPHAFPNMTPTVAQAIKDGFDGRLNSARYVPIMVSQLLSLMPSRLFIRAKGGFRELRLNLTSSSEFAVEGVDYAVNVLQWESMLKADGTPVFSERFCRRYLNSLAYKRV